MALVLQIKKTGINSDGTKITIEDVTGTYNATSNPGGYGPPNDARNQVALILRVYSKRYNHTADLTSTLLVTTPDNSDKLLVTKWDANLLDKDSWIQATIYGLHLYSNTTLFQVGELAYDVISGEIRRILTVSGSGPYTYTYEVVPESALEVETNIIPYKTICNTYAIPNSCECHYHALKIWNETKSEDDFRKYLEIDALLLSTKYSFGFGSYAEGQKLIEAIEDDCGCLSDCNC